MTPAPGHKAALRQAARHERARRPVPVADGARLARHGLALPQLAGARVVAGFEPMADEPPLRPLLDALARRGAEVLVPIFAPGDPGKAGWRKRQPGGHLPQAGAFEALPAAAIAGAQVILAPAFAVDGRGTRLGRGGGWYDRVLVHASEDALILAIVHPWEVVPEGTRLPRDPHDLPVQGWVTAAGAHLLG